VAKRNDGCYTLRRNAQCETQASHVESSWRNDLDRRISCNPSAAASSGRLREQQNIGPPVRSDGTTLKIEAKLKLMGLELPAVMKVPPGFQVKWKQVRVFGTRAVIAGHGPRRTDGTFAGKPGKVGVDLTIAEGYAAARDTALGILGDLKRELGDLDRVVGWVRVFGMVNSAPGFSEQPRVIDGFTDLVVALYGEEIAICPRTVAGVAELALNSPVIIDCEVEIAPGT
jgi:YjgF/chorismate_mutase-like putative endoribonuclease